MTGTGALTVGQEALWYLHRAEPRSPAYNVGFAVRLLSDLDLGILRRALTALVERHDVLRSCFTESQGRPVRVMDRIDVIALRVDECGEIGMEALRAQVEAAAAEPFDLATGAFRVTLFQSEQLAPVLLLTTHHIVTDFVSQGVVMNDLLALYAAIRDDREPELRALRATYDDFVQAEADLLASERAETLDRFWRDECAGVPAIVLLPTDRDPAAGSPISGATARVTLGPQLLDRVEAFARESEVSPFTCLLAAFEIVLARYTGQQDFLVTCPTMPDLRRQRGVAGYYVNPVLIRSDLGQADDFSSLVRAVHQRVARTMLHRDQPFSLVVQALAPTRRAGRAQIGNVAFSLQAADRAGELLHMHAAGERGRSCVVHGVELAAFDVAQQEGQFGLSVEVVRTADDATAVLKYDEASFGEETILQLGKHFRVLLDEALAQPHRRMGELGLLDEAEVDELLRLGAGEPHQVLTSSLLDAVWTNATDRPEAIAVHDGTTTISYGRLARLVTGLASHLAAAGVHRGDVVAVGTGRTVLLPVLALGVMASGATYLPIDPTLPGVRVAFMLDDASVAVLLRSADGLNLAVPDSVHTLDFKTVDEIDEIPGAPAPVDIQAPAYLIYTSGSTGRPKGVAVGHYGLANLADWLRRTLTIGDGSVVLQYASPSFDASIWEIASAFGSGATLYVPGRQVVAGSELATELTRSGATHVTLPPSVLATVAPDQVPDLHAVIVAGEACPEPLARTWASRIEFYNAYGPTETTVCATAHRCGPNDGARVPIGRPLQNLTVHVVADDLRLVPRGVIGQLAVSGPAVAVGYMNRPELTAARFVENPWAPNERLYLTGDRVRWRADGSLEFHGRNDDQIKIRGQRIELGEIDAVLSAHPAVGHAVTVATGTGIGRRLSAYIAGPEVDPVELAAWAAGRLPGYMVPTISVVDAFPLNSSGKIDRGALVSGGGRGSGGSPAATETERRLVLLLADELGLDQVAVDDDFFLLGGHSLLAARLAFRIRESFGTELSLADILARPTAAGLAKSLDRRTDQEVEPLPEARRAPEDTAKPFPLTDVQQAYLLGRRNDFALGGVSASGYFEIEGSELDPHRLEDAWNTVVRKHPMLRAVIVGDQQQVLSEVADYRIQTIDCRADLPAAAEAAVSLIRTEMAHQVLPADRWPLFDIRLTLTPDCRSRLHLTIDGLITDGTGLRQILTEWYDAYHCRELGPAEEVTFRDYVLAEQELENTEIYARSRAYWQARLDDLPPGPALPAPPNLADDKPDGAPHFDRIHHHLPAETWQALQANARRTGLTPSAVALTAYATTLAAWSTSGRFTLTLTMFNRLPLHPEVDRIVGDFTTVTLLEVDLRQPRPFRVAAHDVQRQLWADLDHRYYSGIRVKRDLARRGEAMSRDADMPVVFTSALDESSGGWGFEGFGRLVTATSQTPQVSLDHVVVERDGGLDLVWNVVRSEFPDGLPDAMFDDYRATLERLAYDDRAWNLTRRDHRPQSQILEHRDANETGRPDPVPPLLHEPFFEMSARRPDAVAVRTAHRSLTYGELAHEALRIASGLGALDLPAASLVAVNLAKGPAQVAAVLGVLRAGLAYVPVSPTLPRERQETLLREACPAVILRSTDLAAEQAPATGALPVIEIERLPDFGLAVPEVTTAASDLAYVIYTSGSTGTPKGVMIDHGGAMNTLIDINRRYGITTGDSVLGVSSLSFDLSVYDIFGILAVGGTLVLPDSQHEMDPSHWRRLISEHGVTVWNSVPALIRLLMQWDEIDEVGALTSLRTVMLSGDWIPVDLPDQIRQRSPHTEVISMGGATEASIWSVFHRVGTQPADWQTVPYGRPLAGQEMHILDDSLTPRPTWVAGDLYIGGRGVALGYLHDPDLTNAKFIRHPAWNTRLYRTGDRARWRPDGILEFLGRDDLQVKVNGNRIELGEIEAVLTTHPAVRAAIVSAPQVGQNRVLVAHVVPAAASIDPEELRAHLRRALPAPMVPSTIVEVSRLPLTANGKIDRNQLSQSNTVQRQNVAPDDRSHDDPLQRELAEIWSNALECPVDSIDAHFFTLGGDSLTAVRVLTTVNERHRTQLTLADLYDAPAIGQFASKIRAGVQEASPRSARPSFVEEEL